jgi:hypothetical protein
VSVRVKRQQQKQQAAPAAAAAAAAEAAGKSSYSYASSIVFVWSSSLSLVSAFYRFRDITALHFCILYGHSLFSYRLKCIPLLLTVSVIPQRFKRESTFEIEFKPLVCITFRLLVY